jgi:hypothetical protein
VAGQRCLDAELAARSRAARGFREGWPWYRRSVPYLLVAVACCLVHVGVFEASTRSAVARRIARLEKLIKTGHRPLDGCIEDNKKLAVAIAQAQAAADGRALDKAQLEAAWREHARGMCLLDGLNDTAELEREHQIALLKRAPRTFYVYLAIFTAILGLLTLWARWRPLLASVTATAVAFVALLFLGGFEASDGSWTAHYVLLGAALLAAGVAAANSILHVRD